MKFVVLKVLDKTGAGFTSDVIRAIDFAVANRSTLGVDVINLSLGHPIYEPAATDPLVQAVERASRAGIIVAVELEYKRPGGHDRPSACGGLAGGSHGGHFTRWIRLRTCRSDPEFLPEFHPEFRFGRPIVRR